MSRYNDAARSSGREPLMWPEITETVRRTLREREQGDYLPSNPYGNVGAPMEPDDSRAPAHFEGTEA